MHPEIARRLGEQHRAELHRQAERRRLAAQLRQAQPVRLARLRAAAPPAVRRLLAGRWRRVYGGAGPAPEIPPSAVFLAGPDAFGFRSYLTAGEARELAADWAALLGRFGGREDPARRPAGAVPFEVVVLGHQVPDLAGSGHGRPGPGQAG